MAADLQGFFGFGNWISQDCAGWDHIIRIFQARKAVQFNFRKTIMGLVLRSIPVHEYNSYF